MFRHLVGLFAGIALAPVLWVGVAWSAGVFPDITRGQVNVTTVSSVVVLCLVGAAGAYLVASRLSPMVAGAAGTLLVALCLWPVVYPASMGPGLGWLNEESFLYPSGAGLGVGLPLGVLLLCSAMLPARWRSTHAAGPPAAPEREREVGGTDREGYRSASSSDEPDILTEPEVPWNDGGPVGDTVPDVPPPVSPSREYDDPNKSTTPFRREDGGAGWTPTNEESDRNRPFGDGRL